MKDESLEYKFILENVNGSFVYSDLSGIVNSSTMGSGIFANELVDEISKARGQRIEKMVFFICHSPILNSKSHDFVLRKGFKKLDRVLIENGVILKYYELNLN